MIESQAIDVQIHQLRPLRARKVNSREYDRILASIKAIGLIEPLIVYADGDQYVILDGVQRYRVLAEIGAEVVPCIIGKQREAFTANRMVNRVSPVQENRMIEKSLEELDEHTIAATLGIQGIKYRLKKTLLKNLHPDVATAFDQGKLNRACAREFTHVKPARQREILSAMEGFKDYGIAFARTQILKTSVPMREKRSQRRGGPWDKSAQRKNDLLRKLADTEHKHEFYSNLYKQYTIDLLRLAICARSLLTNARVRAYLDENHATAVRQLEGIISDVRG